MEGRQSKRRKVPDLRFLIATDVHLGHAENHNELGNDSYLAFEEVLSIAKKQQVDFVLLGGDLFDEVNPTQKCIFKCLNLLRDNIFGNRQLQFGVKGIIPNFSNQNLNIELPIFTIHGNHDYPSNDFGKISVCDLLNSSNYVNYFGKHLNLSNQGVKQIVVEPLIFQKNGLSTRLAIYGLGYIKDVKLHKMLQDKDVIFKKPDQEQETVCILIFHQNRYKGKRGGVGASYQNCVHAEQLPKWLDLVIWCHQHEAIYKVETQSDVQIFQPGSTVITSYIQAESFQKQCGIVSIVPNRKLELESILLQRSFRPMYTPSYSLSEISSRFMEGEKINFDQYFDEELSKILSDHADTQIKRKPIVRIKIDYTGHQIIRLIRIEQKYRENVANSNKIFTYSQKRQPKKMLALQDNQVLDMIKNSKVPKNVTRQTQLTQQIMQIFTDEITKSQLHFFQPIQLKDTIIELANNDGRANIADIKQMYAGLIEKKSGDVRKGINTFHKDNDRQFKRIYEKLLKSCKDTMDGSAQQINLNDIQADILRLKSSYAQKQKQIQSTMGQVHQKLPSQSQIQVTSKSTTKTSTNTFKGKGAQKSNQSKLQNRDSESEGRMSVGVSNSSDDDDCCRRAEREDYRENDTRLKFQKANQMASNKDKKNPKGKKNVRFKDG